MKAEWSAPWVRPKGGKAHWISPLRIWFATTESAMRPEEQNRLMV